MHPFRHLATVCRHRRAVRRIARRVGIPCRGLTHDLSKFSPTEFWAGARYWQGTRSPNEEEREELGYSLAWMHHKGRNRHHYEYWVDIDPVTRLYAPVEMPVADTAEMFCDRVAASRVYRGTAYSNRDPLDYFLRGHAKDIMHPATAARLSLWLTTLAEEGETKAFALVRAAVREDKRRRREQKRARRKARRTTSQ